MQAQAKATVPWWLALAAAGVFVWHRAGLDDVARLPEIIRTVVRTIPRPIPPKPVIDVASLTPKEKALFDTLQGVSSADRALLQDFYAGLSRAIKADPANDPVVKTTDDLRRAHRAGMLFVYSGIAGNQADKYPGLGDGLSGVLAEAIGTNDVPLNPTLRVAAADCLARIASLCATR